MTKKHIPTPVCSICREPGGTDYTSGETFYICPNCGTEMRYLPAGGLLLSGGSEVKKNNGWITTFSMFSSELYSGRAMFCIGVLVLVLVLSFLFFKKIGPESAIWCLGSSAFLIILGRRKSLRQQKKMQTARDRYPYWKK